VHLVEAWLAGMPPLAICLVVGLIVGAESMGIPLPGEFTLVTAALISTTGLMDPWTVALAAGVGAIVGDSIGYVAGRRGGRRLLERLGRRFPRHFGPPHLNRAERIFDRHGVWAVFFGRFIALLRILAGPLAGALLVPYRKFLVANASGGVVWAFGTTFTIFFAGRAAEHWLKDFSWAALAATVLVGVGSTVYLKRRALARSGVAAERTVGGVVERRAAAAGKAVAGHPPSGAGSADAGQPPDGPVTSEGAVTADSTAGAAVA
jgi:membrane protein DedA with SNARE-associated domain